MKSFHRLSPIYLPVQFVSTFQRVVILFVSLHAIASWSQIGVEYGSNIEADFPTINLYRFGYGGDVNSDGTVNNEDRETLEASLEMGIGIYPAFDVSQDGQINEDDIGYLAAVISGELPSIVDVDYIEDDLSTGQPGYIEMMGMNLDPGAQIHIGGVQYLADIDGFIKNDNDSVSLKIQFGDDLPLPENGSEVYAVQHVGRTNSVFFLQTGQSLGEFEESTDVPLDPSGGDLDQPEEFATPTENSCCITKIIIRCLLDSVTLDAFGDHDLPANGNGKEIKRDQIANLTLRKTKNVKLIVYENGLRIATYNFNCENIKKGKLEEDLDVGSVGSVTVPRLREIIEIVEFETEQPCDFAASPLVKKARYKKRIEDNARGSFGKYTGSGVKIFLWVPESAILEAGCSKACWMQTVWTTVEKRKKDLDEWETLYDSGWHNDNTNAVRDSATGEPWWCYPYQEVTDLNGQKIRVLRDGPHIRHGGRLIGRDGNIIQLEDGDLIRRRSIFVTSLVCYDPENRPLVTFLWSVTTYYKHNANSENEGGETIFTPPTPINPVNFDGYKRGFDRKELKRYLEKRRREEAKLGATLVHNWPDYVE